MSALTGLQKIALTTLVVVLTGGAVFFFQSQAGTTVGLVSVEPGFVCGTSTVLDADANVYDTVQIGQQCWMQQNMRVGTRVSSSTIQTNNSTTEKYCYGDLDTNCTDNHPNYPDGGMYLWNEAMQYSTAEEARGICPAGFHIPTDQEWHTLESYLTSPDQTCDATRTSIGCEDAATKLLPNGTSGFEANLGGRFQQWALIYSNRGFGGYYWSSTASDPSAWTRRVDNNGSSRTLQDQAMGLSVRCLKDAPTTGMSGTLTTNSDLERGLVGHWTFDGEYMDWGSTTAEIRDRSGNGNHGNASSSISASAMGNIGQGIEFRGLDDGAVITQNGTINNLNTVTLSAWIRHNDVDNSYYDRIFNKTEAFIMYVNGGLYFEANRWDGNAGIWGTTVNVPTGEWIHVTVTYDYGSPTNDPIFYYDGVAVNQIETHTPSGTSLGETNDLILGNSDFGERVFNGTIDDLRIYNRILSAKEVKRLYELGATTKIAETITTNPDLERGLVGHWTFDGEYMDWGSTTAEVRDRSGNANHGDALGGMTTRSNMQGMLGQAMGFDGVTQYLDFGDKTIWDLSNTNSSISIWFKTDMDVNTGDGWFLFERLNIVGGGYGLYFENTSGTPDRLIYRNQATGNDGIASTTLWGMGEWNHVVGVTNTSTNQVLLYLNGELADTGTYSGTLLNRSEPLTIGAEEGGTYPIEGQVDDARIYNRALSADEVKRLYELGN